MMTGRDEFINVVKPVWCASKTEMRCDARTAVHLSESDAQNNGSARRSGCVCACQLPLAQPCTDAHLSKHLAIILNHSICGTRGEL